MSDQDAAYLSSFLFSPCAPAAMFLAERIQRRHPNSAILLYGSANSVLSDASPNDILFDFYVIARTYREAYASWFLRLANRLIPPNVFYVETQSPLGELRAKYAVLSLGHFEKLVSKRTFHSYFWARFAQPVRIVSAPTAMRDRIVGCIKTAIDTFVGRAAALARPGASVQEIWTAGLFRSYKAELRAEPPERVSLLLKNYGDWPQRVSRLPTKPPRRFGALLAWRLRAIQGGTLSVLRLLKGAATFEGGVDYIAWKISRHSGVTVDVKDWERRHPFLGAPFVALRYYRLRAEKMR